MLLTTTTTTTKMKSALFKKRSNMVEGLGPGPEAISERERIREAVEYSVEDALKNGKSECHLSHNPDEQLEIFRSIIEEKGLEDKIELGVRDSKSIGVQGPDGVTKIMKVAVLTRKEIM